MRYLASLLARRSCAEENTIDREIMWIAFMITLRYLTKSKTNMHTHMSKIINNRTLVPGDKNKF